MDCLVAANHADTIYGQPPGLKASREDQLHRRMDSAHRRFLEALKLFATVKRLLGTGIGARGARPLKS